MQIDNANDAELLYDVVWGLKERLHAELKLCTLRHYEAARLPLDFAEFLRP